jgi:hypothetical protein
MTRANRRERDRSARMRVLHVLLSHVHPHRDNTERIHWPTREEAATFLLRLAVEVLLEEYVAWERVSEWFRPTVLPGVPALGDDARRAWYDKAIRYLEANRDSGRDYPVDYY